MEYPEPYRADGRLASEEVVLAAPTSFAGSAQRIWKLTRSDNPAVRAAVLIPTALLLIAFAWTFVAMWYVLIFGVFGLFVFPFRMFRRGSRKEKRRQLQHREMLAQLQGVQAAQMTAAITAQTQAQLPSYGMRTPDGAWWWDGQQWLPTAAPTPPPLPEAPPPPPLIN
jgi:hypothetical protein